MLDCNLIEIIRDWFLDVVDLFGVERINHSAFQARKSRGRRLAGRPVRRSVSQSLIVRLAISASEKRCG